MNGVVVGLVGCSRHYPGMLQSNDCPGHSFSELLDTYLLTGDFVDARNFKMDCYCGIRFSQH